MKLTLSVLSLVLFTGCAHLGLNAAQVDRKSMWNAAHEAFAGDDFALASRLFAKLADEHRETLEGRESLFYSGAISLDPRNPEWDPAPAEKALSQYLNYDTEKAGEIHRRPEGETLYELARQLNMPARERVPGLQPEVVEREVTVPRRVVVPAEESRALAAEVERLRATIAEHEATIQQQREELERIRRTLTRPNT